MSDLSLNLSDKAEKTLNQLKHYFHTESDADIIRKAITLLKIAVEVDQTHGQLIARKGERESVIVIRS